MSTLETNSIGKYNGNNVSIDDALKLKSYTTTQRDALTSVAGDTIYNTTTTKVEYYDGSAWQETGATTFNMDYLLVAGGGGGGQDYYTADSYGRPSTGGGSGGVLTSYGSEFAGPSGVNKPTFSVLVGQSYTVTVGAGGVAGNSSAYGNVNGGSKGGESAFAEIQAIGGTGGGGNAGGATYYARADASGGASGIGGCYLDRNVEHIFIPTQAYGGGDTGITSAGAYPGAGAGGAGAAGGAASNSTGGAGGNGMITTIISDSQATSASVGEVDSGNVYVGGGGGGKGNTSNGPGGLGGGGDGATKRANNSGSGTANTGGGGGAGSTVNTSATRYAGTGGSGLVILRYPNTYTATTSGLTTSTASSGSDSILIITAGTGTVSWA